MQILKQTSTELTIITSSVWTIWLFACPFITIALAFIILMPNTTLACQRVESKQGNCQLTYSSLAWSNTQEISLENLQGAKVEQNDDISKVVLLTKVGEVPFTHYSTSWGDKQSMASDVNSFVENAEHRLLKLDQDDRWFGWMFGGIFLLPGVLIFALAKNEIYSFDKTFGKITVKRWGLLVNDVTEYSNREFSEVELEKTKDSDGNISYDVNLLMVGGDRLSLCSSLDREEQQKIADLIRSYLDGRSH
jgi:hypothetical protein